MGRIKVYILNIYRIQHELSESKVFNVSFKRICQVSGFSSIMKDDYLIVSAIGAIYRAVRFISFISDGLARKTLGLLSMTLC